MALELLHGNGVGSDGFGPGSTCATWKDPAVSPAGTALRPATRHRPVVVAHVAGHPRVPHFPAGPRKGQPIVEVPAFSFILGDLHPTFWPRLRLSGNGRGAGLVAGDQAIANDELRVTNEERSSLVTRRSSFVTRFGAPSPCGCSRLSCWAGCRSQHVGCGHLPVSGAGAFFLAHWFVAGRRAGCWAGRRCWLSPWWRRPWCSICRSISAFARRPARRLSCRF